MSHCLVFKGHGNASKTRSMLKIDQHPWIVFAGRFILRHGFGLIMGDIDHRGGHALVQTSKVARNCMRRQRPGLIKVHRTARSIATR